MITKKMKRGAITFWMLYMLFFAIPFPMILYYSINSEFDVSTLKDKNPWLALSVLVLSIILWAILLIGYFRKWVIQIFIAKRNIEQIKKEGIPREAKILSATKTKSDTHYDTYDLKLSLKNLVNTEIVQQTNVNDIKPFEHRFEVGKKVDLLIDPEMKRMPYFIFASAEASINKKRLACITLGWLLLLAVVIGYYVFSYHLESCGMGWRFIGFGHPLLICPAVLLFYRGLFRFIFRQIAGGARGVDEAVLIKFKGIKTTAKLLNASQTGTYINEQPMIRFELEYTDERQQVHRQSLKKIVSLLDLNTTKQETIDIFYLKENPDRIAFASDLNELS